MVYNPLYSYNAKLKLNWSIVSAHKNLHEGVHLH